MQLAAAALAALRRCRRRAIRWARCPSLRLDDSTRLAGNAPPALTDRLATWRPICCAGSATSSRHGDRCWPGCTVSPPRRPREPWPDCTLPGRPRGGRARRSPRSPTTARRCAGRVEGAILRSLYRRTRRTARPHCPGWMARCSPRPRSAMRRPFLVHAGGLPELINARIEAGTAAAAFAVDLVRRMSGQQQPTPPPTGRTTDRPRTAHPALPGQHAVQRRDRLRALPVGQHREDPPADGLPQTRRRRTARSRATRERTAPALRSPPQPFIPSEPVGVIPIGRIH